LEDITAQRPNLEVLSACEALLALVAELGPTAAYLSQAEIVLPGDHPWIVQAQTGRTAAVAKLSGAPGVIKSGSTSAAIAAESAPFSMASRIFSMGKR
jgi:hypothetical protein